MLAAEILVPLVLLSACSKDDPAPKMPDATTSEPSPTETSSTATPESPEAFIRRFNAANVSMQATGEPEDFLALTRGCRPCDETAEQVASFYERGGFVRWPGWEILRVKASTPSSATRIEVRVDVNSGRTRYKASSSAKAVVLDGGKVTYQATLIPIDDSWLLSDLVELAQ
ncbi:hypothetical protein [Nocardioides sp.]|uniref:hypothetical protein n=1 Tax=Nocardioides sp. TaxID=35761 RepID=UPI00286D9D61|nr:hypothetical protein [Nocardioides sp.]